MASTSSEEPDHRPHGPDDAEEVLQAERGDAGLGDATQAERDAAGRRDAPQAESGDAGVDDAPKEERSDAAPLAKAEGGSAPPEVATGEDCAAWRRRRRKPKESPWWVANQKQRGSAAVFNLLDKGVEHRTRLDTTPTEQVLPDLAIQE